MKINEADEARTAAVQYLIWAIEEIERSGCPRASLHARKALTELCGGVHERIPKRYAEEAKRLRDKADEAEQLAELAQTASRRDALMTTRANYRSTANQMERLSEVQSRTKSR